MNRIKYLAKSLTGGNTRQFGMIFTLIAITLLFQVLTHGLTLSSTNMISVVSQYSYILILAIGMVMVIIAGHIDLSVGSVAAFVGIVVAKAMADFHVPWLLAILLGLVVGALIGAWQGFWVAYVGVPAFIVTLAGMMLFRGANQFFGNAETVTVPKGFQVIGAGYLPEWGPATGYNNPTLLLGLLVAVAVVVREYRGYRTRLQMGSTPIPVWAVMTRSVLMVAVIVFATLRFAGGRVGTSYPVSGIILAVLVVLYAFITRNTTGGRHIYAVGGNSRAAELSGVKLRKVNFMIMTNMSMLAALAGMIFVARSQASGPQDGLGWELDAIASVFIGGAAVAGGVGPVSGSIVGGLVMAILNNGLQLMGVGSDQVQMIKGMVLLVAVAFDVYNKSQGKPSITGILFGGGKKPMIAPMSPAVAGPAVPTSAAAAATTPAPSGSSPSTTATVSSHP
jgi:putative multiple sugar transport system permease protein